MRVRSFKSVNTSASRNVAWSLLSHSGVFIRAVALSLFSLYLIELESVATLKVRYPENSSSSFLSCTYWALMCCDYSDFVIYENPRFSFSYSSCWAFPGPTLSSVTCTLPTSLSIPLLLLVNIIVTQSLRVSAFVVPESCPILLNFQKTWLQLQFHARKSPAIYLCQLLQRTSSPSIC